MHPINATPPTPYPDLNVVLRDLTSSIQAVLEDNFVGLYLQGSFALGDFDLNSDCDFIVVVEAPLSNEEVEALQGVHERIFSLDSAWAQHLEGSYFPKDMLRDNTHSGEPLWYLDHGSRSLTFDSHCNTSLVRWVVREKGVTLAGPEPQTLVDPISAATLREHIMATMQGWEAAILTNPEHYNNRFYQAYIVLSYCRMLHDLHRGFPGSKRAGAEWAKATLDPAWIGLIDRTWAGRIDPAVLVRQPADPDDFKATLEFVRYVMDEAKRVY